MLEVQWNRKPSNNIAQQFTVMGKPSLTGITVLLKIGFLTTPLACADGFTRTNAEFIRVTTGLGSERECGLIVTLDGIKKLLQLDSSPDGSHIKVSIASDEGYGSGNTDELVHAARSPHPISNGV
jgi:hypothetical protein